MQNNIFQNGFNYNLSKPPLLPPTAFGRSNFYNGTDPSKVGFGDPFFGKSKVGQSTFSVKPGESVQERINEAKDKGGGVIYLDVGTFYLDADLILYSNITLRGASGGATTIDFGGGAYSVRIEGDNAYSTGTVTTVKDSVTITGSGTTWTSDMVGQTILVDGNVYTVTTFNSSTSLDLDIGVVTAGAAGLSYVIADFIESVKIEDLTIYNSSVNPLETRYGYFITLNLVNIDTGVTGWNCQDTFAPQFINCNVYGCTTGISLSNCYFYTFGTFSVANCTGVGMLFATTGNATMYDFAVSNNGGVGMKFTGTNILELVSFTADSNGSHGIECVATCDNITFNGGYIDNNTGDGVKLTATSDENTFAQCNFTNNGGYGFNIAASSCDNNIFGLNVITGNTSGTHVDNGTGTVLRANVGIADNNLIEGEMVNGKISVTVSSNDITLALKTIAGTDPSASNPVFVVLDGVTRSVTGALSKTLADGTNWFNSGSTEIGTQEVDYFAGLGYNSTDGVYIGFARRPNLNAIELQTGTSTAENYWAGSQTTFGSTDPIACIGRFAATLSLTGTGHLWTVPTFTRVNLIQEPINETRNLTFTITPSGNMTVASTVTNLARYKLSGDRCIVDFNFTVTTSAGPGTEIRFNYPMAPDDGTVSYGWAIVAQDSTNVAGFAFFESSKIACRSYNSGNWGTGAGRGPEGVIEYGI